MKIAAPFLALATVAGLATPATSGSLNPVGTWQHETGESRFEISMCGTGEQLCARLQWVRPDAINDEYQAYLNKPVAAALQPSGPSAWKGQLTLDGRKVNGTVQMTGANTLQVKGCVFVVCDTVTMTRI